MTSKETGYCVTVLEYVIILPGFSKFTPETHKHKYTNLNVSDTKTVVSLSLLFKGNSEL